MRWIQFCKNYILLTIFWLTEIMRGVYKAIQHTYTIHPYNRLNMLIHSIISHRQIDWKYAVLVFCQVWGRHFPVKVSFCNKTLWEIICVVTMTSTGRWGQTGWASFCQVVTACVSTELLTSGIKSYKALSGPVAPRQTQHKVGLDNTKLTKHIEDSVGITRTYVLITTY